MKIKKRFKQTCNYFLKYANNNSYPNALKEYNKKHTKELLKFQQGNPDLEKRTDFYDNSTVTNVTIYDILSNDGVSKLSKRLHSLSSKEYRCSVFYNKPTIFKSYDYVHLQYSSSSHGYFAEVEFLDDKYIKDVKITWSQINSYFAILEYNFTLKYHLNTEQYSKFVCDNIEKLNTKDYLPYYNLRKNNEINFHLMNEIENDFFVLIFQHFITSIFYSEQGKKYRLINMVHMTREESININTLAFGDCSISYYNKEQNYLITCDSNYNYCLMSGNNSIPHFSLTSYIANYGNSFYYMFFGYRELKIFEIEFSKYSTGRKKAGYGKNFTY